jgi:dTDP-glucose pyrophosphorylase
MGSVTKVVILAAGRGTRMRAAAALPSLDAAQQHAADLGLKALIPFHGHPFLSHVLTTIADAGVPDVCLVVGPGTDPIRVHYSALLPRRLRFAFAVQQEPRGSADALLAAETFTDGDDFLLINADNHYPAAAFAALCALDGPGLIGFSHAGLLQGNISAARLAGYAVVRADAAGYLQSITEKPPAAVLRSHGDEAMFSMTCWRFNRGIFAACRAADASPRGEIELPDAVMHAATVMKERFRVVPLDEPVLDLSTRPDIPAVAARLRGRSVHL